MGKVPDDVMTEIMSNRRDDEAKSRADEGGFDIDPADIFNGSEPDFGEEDSSMDEALSVLRGDMTKIQDSVRYLSNTMMGIERQISDLMAGLGLDSQGKEGGRKGMITPEIVGAITETRDRLKHLDEFGFNAQLSDSFECFKPENMEKIFNRLDQRVDNLNRLSRSYETALSAAVAKAVSRGMIVGVTSGCLGGALAGAIIVFGARLLGF